MAAFSSGCSHPAKLASVTLAENVLSFIFLSLPKDREKPLHCSFHFLLFNSHYPSTSPFLYSSSLHPSFPQFILLCSSLVSWLRRMNRETGRRDTRVGWIKNEFGVATGPAFLLPCHANGFQIRLHIKPRR